MSTPSSFKANRAIGAMFFSVFGGIFFTVWYFRDNIESIFVLALIILLTLCMVLFSMVTYNKNKAAFNDEKEAPEKKRVDKLFHMINFGQWILILIIGNVLANIGRPDLIIPAAIIIIGAHFLPLAAIFKYYPHYITGLLIITWAVVYPLLLGTSDQGVLIGPGVILWLSALLGMTIKPFDTKKL